VILLLNKIDLVPKSNVEVRFFIVFVLSFILSPRG
jgi:hypothetical protein